MANQTFMQFERSDNIIDSRDVIEALDDWRTYIEDELSSDTSELDYEETQEYEYLLELESEFKGYCDDWNYGVTIIAESYFQQYAEEYACDMGAIDDKIMWPHNCIDWEAAADELKQDYTPGTAGGYTYWAR